MKPARKTADGSGSTIHEIRHLLKQAANVAVWLPTSDAAHGGVWVWSTKKWVTTALAVLPDDTRVSARLENCEGHGPTVFLGGPGWV